jgi:hypothetical protein
MESGVVGQHQRQVYAALYKYGAMTAMECFKQDQE